MGYGMRVGIIGAMDQEVELLRNSLIGSTVTTVAGMEFCAGSLGGTEVVVVKSGVGKVNAGICVQILVDRFDITNVINTGVAGSLDDSLDIGDLVVSVDCVWHDVDATPFGYRMGEIPGMGVVEFPADEAMRASALAAAFEVAPEVHAVEGRIVSGDQFVTRMDVKERLVKDFAGSCCEMEGTAIAQAAYSNGIPFVVVRAISDKPGADDQFMDYPTFERQSANRCARIVARMVERSLA